jgi:hypothetical protein
LGRNLVADIRKIVARLERKCLELGVALYGCHKTVKQIMGQERAGEGRPWRSIVCKTIPHLQASRRLNSWITNN